MIAALKHIHMLCAALSISGFVLRGFWAWRAPGMLRRRLVKVVPHVVDTLLLLSAIGLLIAYQWNPFAQGWLVAKIALLVVYIGLGLLALKPWCGAAVRVPAFFAAVLVFAWIANIAFTRTVMPL